MTNEFRKSCRYEIYIGLKDQDTYEEKITGDNFKQLFGEYCKNYEIDFSVGKMMGGYKHNKGYVTETSMLITLIGFEEDKLMHVAKEVKAFVNTDTVMVTKEYIESAFI